MATASVTYALANGTTADATQVSTNFTDLVNFLNTNVVHKDGSVSMSGLLTLHSADPSSSNHATRKSYVDVQDTKAIMVRQSATPSWSTSTASSSAAATTIATVTVTDPGYDYYVWGHATFGFFITGGATLPPDVWSCGLYVDGVIKDRLSVPTPDTTSMSIGVPLRTVAHSTGSNAVVTLRIWRESGASTANFGGDSVMNHLQVYSSRQ
jgi:hypothetical protein